MKDSGGAITLMRLEQIKKERELLADARLEAMERYGVEGWWGVVRSVSCRRIAAILTIAIASFRKRFKSPFG